MCRMGPENLPLLRLALQPDIVEIEELRPGGQALIYRGRRIRTPAGVSTNDHVAIKLYTNLEDEERITREIVAASMVRCETLVDVLSNGTALLGNEPCRYLVSRFIEGISLSDYLSSNRASPSLACTIGRDISLAIAALWQRNLVHRDINPKNIMLRSGMEAAVLIDLGIAKNADHSPLTAAGETWGTRGYLSPEQAAGLKLSCLSDVFSLGVTMQHALAGAHPTSFNQNRLNSGGRPTFEVAPETPAALSHILDRMVSGRAVRRPNPAELVNRFTELLT
jgi:eukaryotic-like serine/threonine-protein kinase